MSIELFARQLLDLIEQASTTTTYKYALMLAIVDLAQESVGRIGGSAGSVTTRQLAARVIQIYWGHGREFPGSNGAVRLKQLTRPQRTIIEMIAEHRGEPGRRAVDKGSTAYQDLLDDVEWLLIRNPIPRLQRFGARPVPFIYEVGWDPEPPRAPVKRYQASLRGLHRGAGSDVSFDNLVRFKPGAEERLTVLAPMLRALIQREWARFVVRCNRDALPESARVEEFLFDPMRVALERVRGPLSALQDHRCFYCGRPLGGAPEVDHFLPWSRTGEDALENLVAAHAACNNAKRDHLAATAHLARWCERLAEHDLLSRAAREARWPTDPVRAYRLARALYVRQPVGSLLWVRGQEFEDADPFGVQGALAPAQRAYPSA